jgi:rubrerythrin
MLDRARRSRSIEGEYVEFTRAGTSVQGEFHCAGCGYGVAVHTALPQCPMCAGTTWEQAASSPFSGRERLQ